MPIVAIENINPGAVLARPVEDSMGRILINAGETLNEQLIAVLKKRGYAEVEVRPDAEQSVSEELQQKVAKHFTDKLKYDKAIQNIRTEVDQRFHNAAESDRPMQIVRLVAQKVLIDNAVQTDA